MKAIAKENGNESILKEGTLEEVKAYLLNDLDNLVDWLNETENNWDNFTELKNEIKNEIKAAETGEEIEQAFKGINTQMSWWGIFVEN